MEPQNQETLAKFGAAIIIALAVIEKSMPGKNSSHMILSEVFNEEKHESSSQTDSKVQELDA